MLHFKFSNYLITYKNRGEQKHLLNYQEINISRNVLLEEKSTLYDKMKMGIISQHGEFCRI